MRVLIACEFSGIVRDAFIARGHDAWSCDLLESERPGPHIVGDVRELLKDKWDMMIAFPPCTYLTRSGARWHWGTERQDKALDFVCELLNADVDKIALENPVGAINSTVAKPDQIIQPWMFGHGETKTTCLWLQGLNKLVPTNIVNGREPRVHYVSPSVNRWRERSRTFEGIAQAMASQWGLPPVTIS